MSRYLKQYSSRNSSHCTEYHTGQYVEQQYAEQPVSQSVERSAQRQSGFTLVELVVVLVILAILAAILVPALLGYIDRARSEQDVLNAKNCMTAMQTQATDMYAHDTSAGINGNTILGSNPYGDVSWIGTPEAQKVLDTADVDPYMLIIGMGDYETYKDSDIHKAYTVYFVVYWPDQNQDPVFFNGTSWQKDYPWKSSGDNYFEVNGETMRLQFYFLAAPDKNLSNNWNSLKQYLNSK